jgi:penicillin-binding protein 2
MNDHLLEDELLASVREARPSLDGEALSPAGAEAEAVLERVLAARRGRRRGAWRRATGGAPVAVAVGATVLVAAVAIVSLRAHTPPGAGLGGGATGAPAKVLERGGAVLKGRIAAGLDAYYGPELSRGTTLKTSLDPALERAGLLALQHAIDDNPPASGGGFVALDPQDGRVYALGSLPTGRTGPVADRVIQAAGPAGSTLAPITALAALESGAWSPDERYDDTGQFCFAGQCRHNAGGAAHGVLDVAQALMVASDDFFYNLGVLTNSPAPAGGALQQWARAFGIGRPTGVDVAGESPGLLPTPAWRGQRNRLEAQCDAASGPFAGGAKHAPGGCGIADGTNRPWSAGDNENLAVGQGDVRVTPLQLAVAYAAIANGGTIVRPHLGRAIDRPDGSLLRSIDPPPVRHLNLHGNDLLAIRAGLRAAASRPGGTSADVFGRFPIPVYGETGTAQYNGQQDYPWYAGFVPASATSRPIVVVVVVDQGGFGAAAAAPVARQLFSQWFFGAPGRWIAGDARTL